MIKKYVSRDFLLIVAVGVFAFASASGLITGEKIQVAADRIEDTTTALPKLLNALMRLLDANGPLVVFALAVWAYIKRKAVLKEGAQTAEIETRKLNVQERIATMRAEISRLQATCDDARKNEPLSTRQGDDRSPY